MVAAGLGGALLLGSGQAREARADTNFRDFSFDRALGSSRLQPSEPFAYRQQALPRRRFGPPPLGGDIYAMNADGSGQVNLTNNDADDYLPAWSPEDFAAMASFMEGYIAMAAAMSSAEAPATIGPPSCCA